MEVLVHWFTDNLSQHISREMVIFIISMIPILELRGGLLAASLLKVSAAKAIPIYYWKYYPDSVYPAFYPSDFQTDEKNKDFPRTDRKTGKTCHGKE